MISPLNPRKTAIDMIMAAMASAIAPIVTRTINFENVRLPENAIRFAKK